MTPPTYVLWDWNGTLLDDTDAAVETLNLMRERRGLGRIEKAYYRNCFAFPVKPFYESLGLWRPGEDWDALAQAYHDIYYRQAFALNRETFDALRLVRELGAGQSIISALRQDLLERDTARFGVAPYMDSIYGVDNLDGRSKLDRARELLAHLDADGVPRASLALIGDSLHDKEVADALGVRIVFCAQGSHAGGRLRAVGPTGDTLLDAVRIALEGN